MNCRFEIVLKYVEIKQRNNGFGWSVDLKYYGITDKA